MADAVKAVRQGMQKEAPDELSGVERHRPGPAAMAIVTPAERHLAILHADQAGIGDGDAMGVAAQIGQHLFRPAEGWLGIDDPVAAPCRRQKAGEGLRVGQFGDIAEEVQLSGLEGSAQRLQKQPPEQARQHPDRQEEARTAGNPAGAVRRRAAARHDAMEMGMVAEGLAPAVQHRDEADPGAEMLGIGGDDAQRLGGCPEQDAVDDLLVLEGYGRNLGRQREDHVEIGHRQQVARARGQPVARDRALAFWAMPVAAGIVGDTHRAAGPAALDMAAERGGPAQFDRGHHAALDASEVAVVSLNVGRAMAAEDIRHLQVGGMARPSAGRHHLQAQAIERALRLRDRRRGNLRVARSGRQVAVSEQHLDDADVDTALEQMGGEAVSQRVHADLLGQSRRLGCGPAGGMEHLHVDRLVAAPRKQPGLGRARRQ